MKLLEPKAVPIALWRHEVMTLYRSRHGNTQGKMRTALEELSSLLGEQATTADLSPSVVDLFAARPGRASTTNGLLGSLRCAFKLATSRGWAKTGLVESCRWRVNRKDPPRMRHHSREAIARVLDFLKAEAVDWPSKRLYAFAAILAYTGVRPSEAKSARVEDLDLDRGFLFVRPHGKALKTVGSEAPVPIPDALERILREWVSQVESEWLIPKMKRDGPWRHGTGGTRPGDRLRERAAAAGVSGFTPLSLRHSLATHLIGAWGLSRGQVKLILRHTTEHTQDYYVHPDLVNLRESVKGFDFTEARRS